MIDWFFKKCCINSGTADASIFEEDCDCDDVELDTVDVDTNVEWIKGN